mgnify:CR=1 FL=1
MAKFEEETEEVEVEYEEVEVDIEKDVLFELMFLAHKRDITLNQLCTEIIEDELLSEKNPDA